MWRLRPLSSQALLLESLGVSIDNKKQVEIPQIECYSLNHDSVTSRVPILIVNSGIKKVDDLKNLAKRYPTSVIISTEQQRISLKTTSNLETISLKNDSDYSRISGILNANNIKDSGHPLDFDSNLNAAIVAMSSATEDFDNRGLFSTHYLKNRIFDDHPGKPDVNALKGTGTDTDGLLEALGWKARSIKDTVCIVTTKQRNFSTLEGSDIAPSYEAVSELSRYQWVILTNGTKWRLYTSRVSSSSTNYFEINLNDNDGPWKYLKVIFGHGSFDGKNPKINLFFDHSILYGAELEEKLAERIMGQDGILLNLTKGMLKHDMKTVFDSVELESAKNNALRTIYRIWFIAYAESRNLLPVSDKKYSPISLQKLRTKLDIHGSDKDGHSCWEYLLVLFDGIRRGSAKNNLPQYNGNLFKLEHDIDEVRINNEWIVPAVRDILERDGDAIDYASLGVRHLGNILESVMEFTVQQAKNDIMLLEKKGKITQVKTKQEAEYAYKKNDLYLASKGGVVVRKSTGSYYTPDEIVKFLVNRGLEPILERRTALIAEDVKAYDKNPSEKNRDICMERLLDIQVLDPAMGSGHFLVEALNRVTSWATEILKNHPSHPLIEELENDRKTILAEQDKKGVKIDANLLTHDVLLKRKIMKRCIFGVDLNPMAVEISKLALWLDSFAIGVPLTYMDHHIKTGDSTIGMFLDDLQDAKNQSLDDWMPGAESNKMLEDVSASSDVTVDQVHQSEEMYCKYQESVSSTRRILDALTASKIDGSILPKKSGIEFVHRFGRYRKNEDTELANTRKKIRVISDRHMFFHWELEMRDAFTDSRKGFDVILGNPPWDRIKSIDDEFFEPYYPTFRSLSPTTKKIAKKKELLKDKSLSAKYDYYKNVFYEKSNFYDTYTKQGTKNNDLGDREISKLVLERALDILTEDGMLSMVLPSQILSSKGSADIRKEMLERDISQLYVFENRKKIFDIDSRYRFMLLTLKNSNKEDKFDVGFYLHNVSSLHSKEEEKEKFGEYYKERIITMFPESFIVPESTGNNNILSKMYKHPKLGEGLDNGLSLSFSEGFRISQHSDLLPNDPNGWPAYQGKTIHQYNHLWAKPELHVSQRTGLEYENKRRYCSKHVDFYNSYRLVFRKVSSPTNMRTIICTIIPPKTFHTDSLRSIIIKRDEALHLDETYVENILHLLGLINSVPFDYCARQITQVNIPPLMNNIPIPHKNQKRIAGLSARLTVGHPDFAGLADAMRISNESLSVSDRIDTTAELDVLVAKSYGLNKEEYKTILESFKLFKENPNLRETDYITWNNNNLKEFYGEMRKKALEIF